MLLITNVLIKGNGNVANLITIHFIQLIFQSMNPALNESPVSSAEKKTHRKTYIVAAIWTLVFSRADAVHSVRYLAVYGTSLNRL